MRQFQRNLRGFDKKRWHVYEGIKDIVDNFYTTLPLVGELRIDGMEERHWKQLMQKTGVTFDLTDNFSLDRLISLNLHKYVDDVSEIVDRAKQENSIEKQLSELEKIWNDLEFEFSSHPSLEVDIKVVKIPEESIECLEQHQTILQTLSSNRFMDFFTDDITSWMDKLGMVDMISNLLLDVQRTWANLENIFIGSDDIRQQLPKDAERFEQVHDRFKEVLKDVNSCPNIVQYCNREALESVLTYLQEQLGICEANLTAYLEEKKKVCLQHPNAAIFPRWTILYLQIQSFSFEGLPTLLLRVYGGFA